MLREKKRGSLWRVGLCEGKRGGLWGSKETNAIGRGKKHLCGGFCFFIGVTIETPLDCYTRLSPEYNFDLVINQMVYNASW